jgi:hypothetical protein
MGANAVVCYKNIAFLRVTQLYFRCPILKEVVNICELVVYGGVVTLLRQIRLSA